MAKTTAAGNDDNATTTEITQHIDWQKIKNWGTYLEATGQTQADIKLAGEILGDGFEVFTGKDGKSNLVNVQMIVVDWQFAEGDYSTDDGGGKSEYVYVRAITRDQRKVAFTDGGSGIYAELRKYTDRTGFTTGPIMTNGLVRSDFKTNDQSGKEIVGTVFRFDLRPVIL